MFIQQILLKFKPPAAQKTPLTYSDLLPVFETVKPTDIYYHYHLQGKQLFVHFLLNDTVYIFYRSATPGAGLWKLSTPNHLKFPKKGATSGQLLFFLLKEIPATSILSPTHTATIKTHPIEFNLEWEKFLAYHFWIINKNIIKKLLRFNHITASDYPSKSPRKMIVANINVLGKEFEVSILVLKKIIFKKPAPPKFDFNQSLPFSLVERNHPILNELWLHFLGENRKFTPESTFESETSIFSNFLYNLLIDEYRESDEYKLKNIFQNPRRN